MHVEAGNHDAAKISLAVKLPFPDAPGLEVTQKCTAGGTFSHGAHSRGQHCHSLLRGAHAHDMIMST